MLRDLSVAANRNLQHHRTHLPAQVIAHARLQTPILTSGSGASNNRSEHAKFSGRVQIFLKVEWRFTKM